MGLLFGYSRFVGFIVLVGRQYLAEFHVVAARHLRHGGGQLCGGNATVLPCQLLAAAALLAIAALALHLDQLLARRLRTDTLMAYGRALVAAQ